MFVGAGANVFYLGLNVEEYVPSEHEFKRLVLLCCCFLQRMCLTQVNFVIR